MEYDDDADDENEDNDEDNDDNEELAEEKDEIIIDYFAPNTVCAIAAASDSTDMFYFVFISESHAAEYDIMDDFNRLIKEGQTYVSGFYLEKFSETSKGYTYTVNTKKSVHFYQESIVYPFVNFQENSKGKRKTMFISAADYCDVLYFVKETKMSIIV